MRAANAALLVGLFVTLSGFRPDDPDSAGLFKFEPGHDVEHHDGDGGVVRVHFTRTGPDAVSLVDQDEDGVPDTVEQVATVYEEVLAFYLAQGFRSPVSDLDVSTGDGGSDAFDVYLIDFGGQADGAFVRDNCLPSKPICSGFAAQENDFAGYGYPNFRVASRILASHELFHAVQAAYDANIGANWGEATATWASEHFDPSLSDFEYFIRGWFESPDRTLDQEPIGPVDGFSYGLAIFPQYLSERFGDDIVRQHWEDLEDGARGVINPTWLSSLIALLDREHQTTFEAAFVEFAEWVIRSGQGRADGTFVNASNYPRVTRELVSLPFYDERLRVYRASMQVWGAAPNGRATVAAAIADTDPAVLEGLTLVLATRKGATVTSTLGEGTRDGVIMAELDVGAGGADELIAVVVNHTTEGQSKRPGLCLGSPEEVLTCAATKVPAVPQPDTEPEVEPQPETEPEVEPIAEAEAEVAEAEPSPRNGDEGCGGAPLGPLTTAGVMSLWALLARCSRLRRPRVIAALASSSSITFSVHSLNETERPCATSSSPSSRRSRLHCRSRSWPSTTTSTRTSCSASTSWSTSANSPPSGSASSCGSSSSSKRGAAPRTRSVATRASPGSTTAASSLLASTTPLRGRTAGCSGSSSACSADSTTNAPTGPASSLEATWGPSGRSRSGSRSASTSKESR